jgi:hypothetical protein
MAKSITDLKNTVNESAQMISNQLQGVESNLLGAFIAVIASAFISNALRIIQYWVPASFILMWILLFNSFIQSYVPWFRKRDRQERIAKTEVAINRIKESSLKLVMFLYTTRLKNSVPMFRAIGITFFISFIALVTYVKGMIKPSSGISITLPIITSLLFISLPFLLHLVLNLVLPRLEKSDLEAVISRIGCLRLLIIIFLGLFFGGAILVLPIWSLVRIYPLYEYNLSGWSLFIVLMLLAVTALTLMNYFSASMVKKEMTIALYNLSNILNRINMNEMAPSQTINKKLYDDLESDYVKAKRYEISADDSLMVNFYSLVPNETYKTYLSSITRKQSKPECETSE